MVPYLDIKVLSVYYKYETIKYEVQSLKTREKTKLHLPAKNVTKTLNNVRTQERGKKVPLVEPL